MSKQIRGHIVNILYEYNGFRIVQLAKKKKGGGKRKLGNKRITIVDGGNLLPSTSPFFTYDLQVRKEQDDYKLESVLGFTRATEIKKSAITKILVLDQRVPRKALGDTISALPDTIEDYAQDVLGYIVHNKYKKPVLRLFEGAFENTLRLEIASHFGCETARLLSDETLETLETWQFCFATGLFYPREASDQCSTRAFRDVEEFLGDESITPSREALELYESCRREFQLYGKTRFRIKGKQDALDELSSTYQVLVPIDKSAGVYTLCCVAAVHRLLYRALLGCISGGEPLCARIYISAELEFFVDNSSSRFKTALWRTTGNAPCEYYPELSRCVANSTAIERLLVLCPDAVSRRVFERYTGMAARVFSPDEPLELSGRTCVVLDRAHHWSYWQAHVALSKIKKAWRILIIGDEIQTPPKPIKGHLFLDLYQSQFFPLLSIRAPKSQALHDLRVMRDIANTLAFNPQSDLLHKKLLERETILERWHRSARLVPSVDDLATEDEDTTTRVLYVCNKREKTLPIAQTKLSVGDWVWLPETGYVHSIAELYSQTRQARCQDELQPHCAIRVDPPEQQHANTRECCGLDAEPSFRRLARHPAQRIEYDVLAYELGNPLLEERVCVLLPLDESVDVGALYNLCSRMHSPSANLILVGSQPDLDEALMRTRSPFARSTCLAEYMRKQNNKRIMSD